MKIFNLKSLIPKFFRIDEADEPEQKKIPSIKDFMSDDELKQKAVLPGSEKDDIINQTKIGDVIREDIAIGTFVEKGMRPWTLLFVIYFKLQPTKEYERKHRPAAVKISDTGEMTVKKYGDVRLYPQQVLSYIKGLENRFGKKIIRHSVDMLKKKLDDKYFNKYPIYDWADPDIIYDEDEGIWDKFIRGTEGGYESEDSYGKTTKVAKSFQTMAGRNIDWGLTLRFELPKNIDSHQKINELIANKANQLKQAIANSPMFRTNEDFILKPYWPSN